MAEAAHYTGTHFGVFEVEHAPHGVRFRDTALDIRPGEMRASLEELQRSELRIRRPAVRKGFVDRRALSREGRGYEPFVELPWDEALEIAAEELRRIYADYGAAAVFGGSYGWASAGRFHHAQSQLHRFLNCLGGYTASVNTYSHAAAEVLLPHVVGTEDDIIYSGTTWPVICDNTRLIVAFGGLPAQTGQVSPGGVSSHRNAYWISRCAERLIEAVTIGPTRNGHDVALGSEWIKPYPNSDTALMLGIAHRLYTTGQYDRSFLDHYTVGFDRFLHYLLGETDGQAKTPKWAAQTCGIEVCRLIQLADRLPKQRTLLTSTWALQRAEHGEQPFWMLVTLACMLGQIGLPGGGFAFGLSSFNGVANPVRRLRFAALPQGHNPVRQRIPVARIADMLENPGGRIDYDGTTITFPDIKAIYWAGGNPFHHHQHLARLRRLWSRPELVIVNDLEWNSVARHADIVFPVASVIERNDIMAPNSDPRIVALRKCVEPIGESRTDYDIFSALSRLLGVEESFTEGRDEMGWLKAMYARSKISFARNRVELPTFEDFWRDGHFVHCPDDERRVGLSNFRADPEKNPLPTPSGLIEIFSERIASFGYSDCQGHPTWLPPKSWLGARADDPDILHLISPQPRHRLHGQLDGNGPSAAAKVRGCEPAYLNPREAMKRGIHDGDLIRVFNEFGSVLCGARIADWIADQVISVETGAWFSPVDNGDVTCAHGNPNVLTPDVGCSRLSQGPSPNSALVFAELFTAPQPENAMRKAPPFV